MKKGNFTMRLALALLLGVASLAPLAMAPAVMAQAAPAPTPPTAPPMSAPTPPVTPAAPSAPAMATPAPPAPEAPPPPPAPPTDPVAIALLNTLETVCMPSAQGGNLAKIAKAAAYRKSGDNWVYKQPGYQFTVLAPGSNPNICQVELVHPVNQAEPAKPLVDALYNWAIFGHGWAIDRNDKHVADGQEFITRSWTHDADGQHQALVLTTIRKADDTPASKSGDTSEMFYSVSKLAS
jgi:hypothetical protein